MFEFFKKRFFRKKKEEIESPEMSRAPDEDLERLRAGVVPPGGEAPVSRSEVERRAVGGATPLRRGRASSGEPPRTERGPAMGERRPAREAPLPRGRESGEGPAGEAPSPSYIPREYGVEEKGSPMPLYEPLVRREGSEIERPIPGRAEERVSEHARIHKDKLEIILSKLDTIDARLRIIEERIRR